MTTADILDRIIRLLDRAPLRYGQRLRLAFQALDVGECGRINLDQFCSAVSLWNRVGLYLADTRDAYHTFRKLDTHGLGHICFDEFAVHLASQTRNMLVAGTSDHIFLAAWENASCSSKHLYCNGYDLRRALSMDASSPFFGFIPAINRSSIGDYRRSC